MNKVNTAALTKPTNGGANAEPLTKLVQTGSELERFQISSMISTAR